MDKRHSSPSPRAALSQRPKTQRKRSNSLPIVEALGCSTPEAELILAEGKAAVRRRFASVHRRGRRRSLEHDESARYHPQDHLKYLDAAITAEPKEDTLEDVDNKAPVHARTLSDATDRSSATVTPMGLADGSAAVRSPTSPLWDYSSDLAKFIQAQLNSVSAYNPMAYLRSCPDLSKPSRIATPHSPVGTVGTVGTGRRSIETPGVIEIPPVRPPLKSAFSEWSSTDEGTEDEASPFTGARSRKASRAGNYTPSGILKYYEHSAGSSFLFTSTPLEEEQQRKRTGDPGLSPGAGKHRPHIEGQYEADYPSSTLSTHPQFTSSSAPSLSSTSTASYFEYKRTRSRTPLSTDRNLLPVPQSHKDQNVIPAISPFEGAAISNVHDIIVESRNQIRVDGMTFDLMQTSNVSNGLLGLHTPC